MSANKIDIAGAVVYGTFVLGVLAFNLSLLIGVCWLGYEGIVYLSNANAETAAAHE